MNTAGVKEISFKLLLVLLSAVILFHLCIITKLIPYNIAWGGRLENDKQMYVFESLSILINLFLISVLWIKNRSINHRFSQKLLNNILWAFFTLFLLNTIGNIFAKTNFEKYFAILTFVFSVLIYTIIKEEQQNGMSGTKE